MPLLQIIFCTHFVFYMPLYGLTVYLGAVQSAEWFVSTTAYLPQRRTEAPLVCSQRQVLGVVDALGGHPRDTLQENYRVRYHTLNWITNITLNRVGLWRRGSDLLWAEQ